MLPLWKNRLTLGAAASVPAHNIRAGIGYLLMRMANDAVRSVTEMDGATYEVMVRSGDSMAKIAKEVGSTVESMQALNPHAHILQPGQVLRYQKAQFRKVITSWKLVTTSNIATYYNVGDANYARKLDYALSVMRKGKNAICAH